MKNFKYFSVFIVTILILFFMNCQRGQDSASSGNEIALVMKTLNNPFFIDMKKGAEEAAKEFPVKIVAFAPGVVDTNMQAQIRETNKEDFTNLDRFIALKEEGKLLSPEYVAKAIRNLLETEDFPQGEVIRIDE